MGEQGTKITRRGHPYARNAIALVIGETREQRFDIGGDLGEEGFGIGKVIAAPRDRDGLPGNVLEQHLYVLPADLHTQRIPALRVEMIRGRRLAAPPAQHFAANDEVARFEIGQDTRRGLRAKPRAARDIGIGNAGNAGNQRQDSAFVGQPHARLGDAAYDWFEHILIGQFTHGAEINAVWMADARTEYLP